MAWKIEDHYDGPDERVCSVKIDEAEFRIEYGLVRRGIGEDERHTCCARIVRYEPHYQRIAAVTVTASDRADALRRARRYAWAILAPELP